MSGVPESSFVLHVPHASTFIPRDVRQSILLSDEALAVELLAMTDHFTDELAARACPCASLVLSPVSRLVVDPERFLDDDEEPMSNIGMGVVYSRTSTGALLRKAISADEREALISAYYTPHHAELAGAVERALDGYGQCTVLDIHSFPSRALPYELDQTPIRPDLCLGTDDFHTPDGMVSIIEDGFRAAGWSVARNRPFSGTVVPMRYYRRDPRVRSVMIELNRALYMSEATGERRPGFGQVADILRRVIGNLHDMTVADGGSNRLM